MDARYWERVGRRYEEEIFASSRADRRGVIRSRLDELALPRGRAVDFGCGVGHYLPLLARRFGSVHAVDFADSLLEQARARTRGLDNVSFHRANLASGRARLPFAKAQVGICANVLLSPDPKARRGILRSIARHLAPRGRLLLVVPSFESVLFANQRLIAWNRRLGHGEADSLASGIPPTKRSAVELLQGLVRIEGVPTKHYLREEVSVLLDEAGFDPLHCEKVEYGWETEFEDPPAWMREPGPWDWLFVARRRSEQRQGTGG
jgi:SAM-dependent methyltransferase